MMTAARIVRLADGDNVYVAIVPLRTGDEVSAEDETVRVRQDVQLGHKVAAREIAAGQPVIRGGMAIGVATEAIAAGDWVHTHNLVSTYIRTFEHRGGHDD